MKLGVDRTARQQICFSRIYFSSGQECQARPPYALTLRFVPCVLGYRSFQQPLSGLEPGDLLCGIVKFTTDTEDYVKSVTISFTGQTIVSLSQPPTTHSAYTHPSCGILFRLHLVLQGAQQLHSKGTQIWPFAFLVPSHATFAPGGHFSSTTEYFDCESPWRGSSDAETLLLPPSMSYKTGFTCSVQYGLHASLVRPPTAHLFGRRDLSVYTPVKLSPSSMVSNIPRNMNGIPFQYIDRTLGETKPWKLGLLPRLPFMPRTTG